MGRHPQLTQLKPQGVPGQSGRSALLHRPCRVQGFHASLLSNLHPPPPTIAGQSPRSLVPMRVQPGRFPHAALLQSAHWALPHSEGSGPGGGSTRLRHPHRHLPHRADAALRQRWTRQRQTRGARHLQDHRHERSQQSPRKRQPGLQHRFYPRTGPRIAFPSLSFFLSFAIPVAGRHENDKERCRGSDSYSESSSSTAASVLGTMGEFLPRFRSHPSSRRAAVG